MFIGCYNIAMKFIKYIKTGAWMLDDGRKIGTAINDINHRLAGYDRLLKERNDLDIRYQNSLITIMELNQIIAEKNKIIDKLQK